MGTCYTKILVTKYTSFDMNLVIKVHIRKTLAHIQHPCSTQTTNFMNCLESKISRICEELIFFQTIGGFLQFSNNTDKKHLQIFVRLGWIPPESPKY